MGGIVGLGSVPKKEGGETISIDAGGRISQSMIRHRARGRA